MIPISRYAPLSTTLPSFSAAGQAVSNEHPLQTSFSPVEDAEAMEMKWSIGTEHTWLASWSCLTLAPNQAPVATIAATPTAAIRPLALACDIERKYESR